MENNEKRVNNINFKSFITSLIIIFSLMVLSYALTFIIQPGEYIHLADGSIDPTIPFKNVDASLPFYKWILSPFLVLGSSDSKTLIFVIVFLLIIGSIFNALNKSNMVNYGLNIVVNKYKKSRFKLLFVLILVFMLLGSICGSFEEVVPFVPIIVTLCIELGFDTFTGLLVSIIATGCGFASGILNPFTVCVAQNLANVPLLSGAWMRIISFIIIYTILSSFTYFRCKKIAKDVLDTESSEEFERNKNLEKGIIIFISFITFGVLMVVLSVFIKAFQDLTTIFIALSFLLGGLIACFASKMKGKDIFKSCLDGLISILPAVLMILMASSIKYTLTEGKILDTMLHFAIDIASQLTPAFVILFIYLIVLVMNFFIASGSAKAFLLIPLLVPLAKIFGIPPQLCILAYIFGDGFSNIVYPTNPVLLISLSLADMSYGKYIKKSWLLHLIILVVTSLLLLFALSVNYH